MQHHLRSGLALLIASTLTALAAPAAASAASSYAIDACESGQQNMYVYGQNASTFDHSQVCGGTSWGKGAGLQVWSTNGTASGATGGGWWFHPVAGTSIAAVNSVLDDFSAWGGWVAHFATTEDGGGDPFGATSGVDCQSTSCNADHSTGVGPAALSDVSEFGFAIWCHASSCPANSGSSTFGPAGSANVANIHLQIADSYTSPALSGVGGSLWGHSGWVAGAAAKTSLSMSAGAADPSGVCTLQISMSGPSAVPAATSNVAPNGYYPAPCAPGVQGPSNAIPSRSVSFAPDLSGLGTGAYTITVTATNAAGNPANASSTLYVDNSPPTATVNGNGDTVAIDAGDVGSGLGHVTCSGPGAPASIPAANLPYSFTPTQAGSDTITCQAVDNAGNVGAGASATVTVSAAAAAAAANSTQTTPVTQTSPAAPSSKAKGRRMKVRFKFAWTWHGRITFLNHLRPAGRLPRRAYIRYSCRGRGCPDVKVHKPRHGRLTLRDVLDTALKRYRAGDLLTIIVRAPHYTPEVIHARIRSGRIPRLSRSS